MTTLRAASFPPNAAYDLTVTIASGQDTSGEIDLGGSKLVGLYIPSSLRSVATLTLLTAPEPGGTFVELANAEGSGAANYTITLTANKYVWLGPEKTAGLQFIKLKGNANASGGDLVLRLATLAY